MAKPSSSSNSKRKRPAPAAPARPSPPESAAKALAEVLPRLRALSAAALLPVNTDVPRAVSIALGAAPRIAEYRTAITEHFKVFELAHVDDLPTLAMAAFHAHLQWVATTDPGEPEFDTLLTSALALRRTLLADASALAPRGLLDAARVEEIREGRGHLDAAADLVALSALFEEAWPRVENRTAATHQEVEDAAVLGTRLLVALSRRGEAGATISTTDDAEDVRTRAFTALRLAYDECRRALGYLRWHERDADVIAPSLFSRPRASKARGSAAGDGIDEAAGADEGSDESSDAAGSGGVSR